MGLGRIEGLKWESIASESQITVSLSSSTGTFAASEYFFNSECEFAVDKEILISSNEILFAASINHALNDQLE